MTYKTKHWKRKNNKVFIVNLIPLSFKWNQFIKCSVILTFKKLQWNHRHVWRHLTENASSCGTLILQCDYPNWRTWKKIVQSERFLKTKGSKVFCKRTNNIHEFEGCFLRGQVRSNAFKVFIGYVVESWTLLVPLQEKLANLLFSEIVVIRQSSSKNPSSSGRTVKDRHSWLVFILQQLINSKWRLFMLPMGTSLESLFFFRASWYRLSRF